MSPPSLPPATSGLFSHVTAEKPAFYRAILDLFAAAKRQFTVNLRPDDVLRDARWPEARPTLEEVQLGLNQLVAWGNLQAQADTTRVSTIEDFYRKRLLYRLSAGGEAVEAALQVFLATLDRRAQLQSVALEDIRTRLLALLELSRGEPLDAVRVHEALRDLMHVFEGLADNAESFMAGLARSIDLQRAEIAVVMTFKTRLMEYLERFVGDLVIRSGQIAALLDALAPRADPLLQQAALREARDEAPGDSATEVAAVAPRLILWRERWEGLMRWFVSEAGTLSQAELLRRSALAAIPRLLAAVASLHERRAGRSDRAADFRRLALWFLDARDEPGGHRLWRAAFALSPARHLALKVPVEGVRAGVPWKDAPPVAVHPQLRERGELATRGPPARIQDRSRERELLATRVAQELAQTEAARERLATGRLTRLSELGVLDRHAFALFLQLLGEALTRQRSLDEPIEHSAGDGTLSIRLEPLGADTHAVIETELGSFAGRDYRILICEV
jgi:uncharacterized protein (TIGR02677 family)